MEKNKLSTRDQLKTYFEKGKYPTQSQFSDLIDSLTLKEDVMTNKETAILANILASLDNGYIDYSSSQVGTLQFPIAISSRDEEDQEITIGNTSYRMEKRYFLGSEPYTIKVKKISGEELGENEYYSLIYQINQNFTINKFFGNNLPAIPDGFELGTLEGKRLSIQIVKQNLGRKVNIVNTSIRFINKTGVLIQYRAEAGSWGDIYRSEDTVTDHYDIGDFLYLYYNVDLRKTEQSIVCKVYDTDNEGLLMTGYLNAGQNNQNSWGGGVINKIRNIRIECDYGDIIPQDPGNNWT
ncbi:hypothetical protein IW15_17000 [Chryseobacterium soli]|uniref:Uncharacterized protein n=1 Tax=Chryseobacterium soli TaxID=445961 RepID=A0A086A2G4_9FLAO|nr:hypothetical protein [Chryseobacterium soli]KFF10878.1 hypothetical protein IW15_17000 [Chryseobacterium soli]